MISIEPCNSRVLVERDRIRSRVRGVGCRSLFALLTVIQKLIILDGLEHRIMLGIIFGRKELVESIIDKINEFDMIIIGIEKGIPFGN